MSKEEPFKRWKVRSRQKAQKLVNNPGFQKDAELLRAKHELPSQGIKTNKESERWYRRFYDKDAQYFQLEWPKHRGALNELRETNYRKFLEEQERLNSLAPVNLLKADIETLSVKHKLGPSWHRSLRRYLLFNDVELMQFPIGVSIEIKHADIAGQERLYLVIEEDTTIRDIKATWPLVKLHQRNLSYRKRKTAQPMKTFDRNQRAYQLFQELKNAKLTADKLGDELKTGYSATDIYDFIKLYKKAVGIS